MLGLIMPLCACPFVLKTEAIEVKADTSIESKSAILMDYETQEVLFEKDPHKKLPVASMVKMMTILLVLEDVESGKVALNDIVTTSENASSMGGSQVFIDPYAGYKLEELLKSVVIASANDSSVALSEYLAGNESNFVNRMNKRAKELGMNDTHYVNCTGLPAPEQYSSAYDSAIILREVGKFEEYHKYSSIWMDQIVHPSNRVTGLTNTNRLVKYYEGCDGGKTGSTNEAGCCLSATAKRDDLRLISVIVGAQNSKTRFNECSSLFNYGFANFENSKIVDSENVLQNIKVSKGKVEDVDVFAGEDYFALINKNEESNYEVKIEAPTVIKAGVKAFDSVGKIKILKNNELFKEIDLVVKSDLAKMSYGDSMQKVLTKW